MVRLMGNINVRRVCINPVTCFRSHNLNVIDEPSLSSYLVWTGLILRFISSLFGNFMGVCLFCPDPFNLLHCFVLLISVL